ncbi:zinc finger protein 780B isoform X2 [Plectropomus leopardus]|uniref:zinc finger protein 780B isoform X2 n=1 Tax=Plectropomus leopardus TaxID=160734 RepID=UPI001C4A9D42|nr:zinc finger protein 780B isoform X2 [Plectropomus leopardus]
MDEAAAAAIRQDGAANKPRNGNTASENIVGPSAEDTADGVFCCRDCGEAFREEAAYLEHRHQHPQESLYLDDQLDSLHEAEKDSETANFCTLCSLSFVETSEFHSHMEKSHGQTSQKESNSQINSGITKQHTYECPDCGKCYGVIGHFLNHQRSHRQASKSVFHDLEHLKKKSFQCESCGRNYSRASALDAHRRCHEEKLVKSRNKSSGDAFHTEESIVEAKLSEMQAEDTSEKTFKCSCGKAFTALLRLKTHQRFSRNSQCSPEEMKEKPKKTCSEFYCSECKKSFNGHIALFNHQRWHDNHSHDSAKRFPCEECGKVFMTLTFYYRHQRMAHSDETPAKSFLHQVCQLQKKAFECKDCGLKFSRASALHAHQLHHTDVFKETEKEGQMHTSLLPQQNTLEIESKETEQEEVESENVLLTSMAEEDLHVNETDEELESYEPGDFNVQVISASESEDEPVQELNPDLELLCESDQEMRDDCGAGVSSSSLVSKPGLDLKIVQIDFEEMDEQCALIAREAESNTSEERFHCPECYRWFTSASSLRVHRMWHGVRKRRQQTQVKQQSIECEDCGLKFTDWEVFKTHLHQHALEEEEEETQTGDDMDSGRGDDGENRDDDMGSDVDVCDMSSSSQTQPSELTPRVRDASAAERKHACSVCGKVYKYWESFRKHQQLHEVLPPPTKSLSVPNLREYQCPECGISFIRRARLLGHLRVHRTYKSKTPRCDQCNKDFSSLKSWMAHVELHKQRPFWCLSCVKGFRDEASLDQHLQVHNLREYKCNICPKSFQMAIQLRNHHRIHTGAKPYQCSFCGKRFALAGKLILHRKTHLRNYSGSGGMPLGIKNNAIFAKKQLMKNKRFVLASVEEEPEVFTNMEELPRDEVCVKRRETRELFENAESGDCAESEDSDCGEPAHHFRLSKPLSSAGSHPPDESKSVTVQPQTGQEWNESQLQETDMHREHKYWEWECIECDMGFDEVEQLHLHYIKHATGELPIPQDDVEA